MAGCQSKLAINWTAYNLSRVDVQGSQEFCSHGPEIFLIRKECGAIFLTTCKIIFKRYTLGSPVIFFLTRVMLAGHLREDKTFSSCANRDVLTHPKNCMMDIKLYFFKECNIVYPNYSKYFMWM